MKTLYTLIALLLLSSFGNAQDLKEARILYSQGNYIAALPIFEEVLKSNPDDSQINQLAAICVLKIHGDKTKAIDYLQRSIATGKYDKDAYFYLGEACAINYEFGRALDYYTKYLATVSPKLSADVKKRITDCETAVELMKYPIEVSYSNLGPEINSEYPEYNPFVPADESMLLFNSRRKRSGIAAEFDGYFPADIMISEWKNEGLTAAKPLNETVNTKHDDMVVGISSNGDRIFIYYDDITVETVDLHVSYLTSASKFQKSTVFQEIGGTYDVETSATLSPDEQAIVFASNKADGFGKTDLYIIRRLPSGDWSPAQNLGKEVNTEFQEDFPQFSADGKYLFFSSNGHPGMGGFDLYMTEWNKENNVWTVPKNLGYPINTPRNNTSICFNAEGTSAYTAMWAPDSYGDLDIYRMDIGDKANLPALVRVQTSTGDPENPMVMNEIKVTDEYDELVGIYRPHPRTGKYVMALNPGKYFMYLDAEGYQPYSELVMISDYYARADQNVKVIKLAKAGK